MRARPDCAACSLPGSPTLTRRAVRAARSSDQAGEVRDPLFLRSSLLNGSVRRSSFTRFSGYRAPSAPRRRSCVSAEAGSPAARMRPPVWAV